MVVTGHLNRETKPLSTAARAAVSRLTRPDKDTAEEKFERLYVAAIKTRQGGDAEADETQSTTASTEAPAKRTAKKAAKKTAARKAPAKKAAAKKATKKAAPKKAAKKATSAEGVDNTDAEPDDPDSIDDIDGPDADLEDVEIDDDLEVDDEDDEDDAEDEEAETAPAGAKTPAKESAKTEPAAKSGDFVWDEEESEALRQARKDAELTASADSVRAYLKQIGKVALLNAEEEVELAKRIEAGLFATERLRRMMIPARRSAPRRSAT